MINKMININKTILLKIKSTQKTPKYIKQKNLTEKKSQK